MDCPHWFITVCAVPMGVFFFHLDTNQHFVPNYISAKCELRDVIYSLPLLFVPADYLNNNRSIEKQLGTFFATDIFKTAQTY
jgi:hypothetical protein